MPTLPLADVTAALRAAGCVFAEDEARLLVELRPLPRRPGRPVARRVAGEPLEHVLGWAEFCGLRIAVDPGVFVPRRRTELLVRLATPLLRPGDVVVELCCGAAAVATALAAAVPGLELHAVDIDPAAVACARRNLVDGAGVRGRPRRTPAGVAAGTGRRRGRQRALRADRRDRADAARGP